MSTKRPSMKPLAGGSQVLTPDDENMRGSAVVALAPWFTPTNAKPGVPASAAMLASIMPCTVAVSVPPPPPPGPISVEPREVGRASPAGGDDVDILLPRGGEDLGALLREERVSIGRRRRRHADGTLAEEAVDVGDQRVDRAR